MAERPKLIVRVSGGLGNQMFGYAAARRLAIANDAELVIDPWSGFVRDAVYRRRYALEPFAIAGRPATKAEMLRPFERLRRALFKRRETARRFEARRYIAQESDRFEPRLLDRAIAGATFIEGVWPSEDYFADAAARIRADFTLKDAPGAPNDAIARRMAETNSVAVHVRWFAADATDTSRNVGAAYYAGACAAMAERAGATPHYFIFSDRPAEAAKKLGLSPDIATLVDHNQGALAAHWDLWLMSRCRHAIVANSTFSWWGAWLGDAAAPGRVVVAPDPARYPAMGWNSERFVPDRWLKL